MSLPVAPGSTGAGVAPTLQLRLPVPTGDPAAVRALAGAFDALAHGVDDLVGGAQDSLGRLAPEWCGLASLACQDTTRRVDEVGGQVRLVLLRSAEDLRDYAAALEKALAHHGWSLGKLLTLGAIVVVSGGALGVTLAGAAAVAGTVEAGEAAAAAEGAVAAADSADAAAATVTEALASTSRALADVRELARLALPHLASGELNAAPTAFLDEWRRGRIDWDGVADGLVAGMAGSAVTGELDQVAEVRFARSPAWARTAAPYAVRAGVNAASSAAQNALADDDVTLTGLLVSAGEGGGQQAGVRAFEVAVSRRASAAAG